jgi:ABC-type thiamine transport system substrate-binding protein
LSFQDIIQKDVTLSKFIQIYDSFDGQAYVYNWVECSHFKIDSQIKDFFIHFDDTKTLSENLINHNLESRQDIVYGFLQNRTLLYKQV